MSKVEIGAWFLDKSNLCRVILPLAQSMVQRELLPEDFFKFSFLKPTRKSTRDSS